MARLLDANAQGADVAVAGLIHDTRLIDGGELFLALKGQTTDGHDHINTAREMGAGAALVARPVDDPLPQVIVGDVLAAAGQLAGAWRASLDVSVVGIRATTTTKSACRSPYRGWMPATNTPSSKWGRRARVIFVTCRSWSSPRWGS
jgi:UDP-N-acetylmuramyl pentapeptide synthase